MTNDALKRKVRWRLVLGEEADDGDGSGLDAEGRRRDKMLEFLYGREYGGKRNVRRGSGKEGADGEGDAEDRHGGLEASNLTVPDWINAIHELFPQRTIERLEKDALERYNLEEMVTNPDLLRRAAPSQTLLKAVLRTKHLMNQEVLGLARTLVRRVVEELMKKLATEIRTPFTGSVNRMQRSFIKVAKNFDAPMTIHHNLANYDPKSKRMFIKTPYFNSRIRRHVDKWQIIIVVDESGSMMDSVIHSAITAAIFWGIKTLRTHLVIFDTSVVDLTHDCSDPVEALMKVQLGGGTDIGQALAYAQGLVENPRRAIIVLVTDFFEGAPLNNLYTVTRELCQSGVHLLGLAALDSQAHPNFNRDVAEHMVQLGAQVGAMTPGELAQWVAEKVR
jgi:Mg-chelatase subunit ChlD